MLDTVFSPSFGNRPAYLVGRQTEMDNMTRNLQAYRGSRERAMLILGQRGYGKTVLLLEFMEIARTMDYIVTSPTIVATGMTKRILEKLKQSGQEYLERDRPKLSGGSVSILGFGGGLEFQSGREEAHSFAYRLNELCEKINLAGKGVLILIDEVRANNEELKQLIIAYQEMVGAGLNVAIAMAGLPGAISATLNDHVLTFLNRANKIHLGPLPTNEIIPYYYRSFQKLGVRISDETCDSLAAETGGSPYLMQLIGHYVTLYSDDEGRLTDEDLSRALKIARDSFINDICVTTLSSLSARDIDFLTAMSEDEGDSQLADLATRMGTSASYVNNYKKRMIDAGIISQPRRGLVRFDISCMRDYLRGNS